MTKNQVAERARKYHEERGKWGSHGEALANEVDRLASALAQSAATVADLQQFHDWAEPQVHDHGRDVLEIERLRELLKIAKCPSEATYGHEGTWQCQWCDERKTALSSAPEPCADYQAPIAKVTVPNLGGPVVSLYAPGLPPGDHDLYCEPHASLRCLHRGGCEEPEYKRGLCRAHYLETVATPLKSGGELCQCGIMAPAPGQRCAKCGVRFRGDF